MSAQTKPNIASINGVNDGINHIFHMVDKNLGGYIQDPTDRDQLNLCCEYIHQLNGLLEMLELSGPLLIGQSIEKLTTALFNSEVQAEQEVLHVLKQANNGLHRYLNELVNGVTESPMRLFPIYCQIMEVQGQKSIAESDLFFPNIVEDIPLQGLSSSEVDVQDVAKHARADYQTGLLKWLRNADDGTGLQQMLLATQQVECLPGSDQQRRFWWVTVGFCKVC